MAKQTSYTSLKGNTSEGRPVGQDHPHHIAASGCEVVPGATRADGGMALRAIKSARKGTKNAGY